MSEPIQKTYTTPQLTKELEFNPISRGDKNQYVKRMQEWLCFHGFKVVIDSHWGDATQYALNKFLEVYDEKWMGEHEHEEVYELGELDWYALVNPVHIVTAYPLIPFNDSAPFSLVVSRLASLYRGTGAKEIGGNNRGPWVRAFMDGDEGNSAPWCAGFVSFLLRQAEFICGKKNPFQYTQSSSNFYNQAKALGRLVKETSFGPKTPAMIFVLPGGDTGYRHTGLAVHFNGSVIETIEGNSNSGGSVEGDCVCRQIRNVNSIRLISLDV